MNVKAIPAMLSARWIYIVGNVTIITYYIHMKKLISFKLKWKLYSVQYLVVSGQLQGIWNIDREPLENGSNGEYSCSFIPEST